MSGFSSMFSQLLKLFPRTEFQALVKRTYWIRGVYYPLLISHLSLAALIVPLALTTIYRAWRGQFARHMRIARWTLPVWLYVSVTGVIVYWMLYHVGPQP